MAAVDLLLFCVSRSEVAYERVQSRQPAEEGDRTKQENGLSPVPAEPGQDCDVDDARRDDDWETNASDQLHAPTLRNLTDTVAPDSRRQLGTTDRRHERIGTGKWIASTHDDAAWR